MLTELGIVTFTGSNNIFIFGSFFFYEKSEDFDFMVCKDNSKIIWDVISPTCNRKGKNGELGEFRYNTKLASIERSIINEVKRYKNE